MNEFAAFTTGEISSPAEIATSGKFASNNPRQFLQGVPVFEAYLFGLEQRFARVALWLTEQSVSNQPLPDAQVVPDIHGQQPCSSSTRWSSPSDSAINQRKVILPFVPARME